MTGLTRRLTLLRHAKSSWDNEGLADFDRPLNDRGRRDAPLMGRRLCRRGARPSLMITSPAVRARRTARLIANEINYPREFIQREDELYLATPEQLLRVLARQDDSFRDILLCGHNPGITDLANRLTGAGIDNVPTTGIVVISTEAPRWADLAATGGSLLLFDYPRRDDRT